MCGLWLLLVWLFCFGVVKERGEKEKWWQSGECVRVSGVFVVGFVFGVLGQKWTLFVLLFTKLPLLFFVFFKEYRNLYELALCYLWIIYNIYFNDNNLKENGGGYFRMYH